MIGIEDWMGLQCMYGPRYTWEGFQLMGFQAAIFRSASRAGQPIIAWITPSDETNLVLKTSSALAQGAKHFYYWTYGPTATSTENYWSDLRGAYDGIVRMTRQLASAEHIIVPGSYASLRGVSRGQRGPILITPLQLLGAGDEPAPEPFTALPADRRHGYAPVRRSKAYPSKTATSGRVGRLQGST